MSDIATLLAAFFGAWFAFRLQDNSKLRAEQASNISAANKALFVVFQKLNTLKIIQCDMINPVRDHPAIFIVMQPVLYEEQTNFQFDFPSLAFLLNTKHKQLLMDMFIEQQRFQEAINSIKHRSSVHINQVQPILEAGGIQEGVGYTIKELSDVLGERLFKIMQRTTNQVVYHVDRTVSILYSLKEKMLKAFKELNPEADFLNFELIETSSNNKHKL